MFVWCLFSRSYAGVCVIDKPLWLYIEEGAMWTSVTFHKPPSEPVNQAQTDLSLTSHITQHKDNMLIYQTM